MSACHRISFLGMRIVFAENLYIRAEDHIMQQGLGFFLKAKAMGGKVFFFFFFLVAYS